MKKLFLTFAILTAILSSCTPVTENGSSPIDSTTVDSTIVDTVVTTPPVDSTVVDTAAVDSVK